MSEDCPHCVFEKTEANCRGCFEGSHYKPKQITNADRIRAMSDEELAKLFISIQDDVANYFNGGAEKMPKFPTFPSTWLDWLKEEAGE